jgi:hypothetical protein
MPFVFVATLLAALATLRWWVWLFWCLAGGCRWRSKRRSDAQTNVARTLIASRILQRWVLRKVYDVTWRVFAVDLMVPDYDDPQSSNVWASRPTRNSVAGRAADLPKLHEKWADRNPRGFGLTPHLFLADPS